MNKLDISETVKIIQTHLPPLPEIVADLLGSMGQENIDIDTLSEKLSHDQALVATTLRLANSSFYGMPRRVTSIREAFAILGLKSVRTLITAAAVTHGFIANHHTADEIEKNWRHSIAVAVCAKALARQLHLDQEQAFTAGLLHDIGKLVLAIYFPLQYQATLAHRSTQDCTSFQAERAVLGIDHAMVGLALAGHWKFPLEMQLAIGNHHAPEAGHSPLILLVHVADSIVHALDLALDEDEMVPPVSPAAWNSLGIGQDAFLQVFDETEQQFDEMCQILVA